MLSIDDDKVKKRFNSMESKRITKILENEFKYMKRTLLLLLIFLLIIISLFATYMLTGDQYYSYAYTIVTFAGFICIIFIAIQLENKRYKKLSTYDRQFYLLNLMKKNMSSDFVGNRFKLYSLVGAFSKELYYVKLEHKKLFIFNIYEEEIEIEIVSKSFTQKIRGHILDNLYRNEIYEITNLLLYINQYRNTDSFSNPNIDSMNELSASKMHLFSLLSELPESPTKVDVLGIEKILKKIRVVNLDVIWVIFSTIILISMYLLLSTILGETINVGMIFTLLIAAPSSIAAFLNMFRKS